MTQTPSYRLPPDVLAVLSSASTAKTWLVTGAAGFIGSHVCEQLLLAGQQVMGVDDFSTGTVANVNAVRAAVGAREAAFQFVEGDIRDAAMCNYLCSHATIVLHQAALGSVPRSVKDPVTTQSVNDGGFVQLLSAAQRAGITRFVYASSSSVYGDDPTLPKVEPRLGRLLSPYAATKRTNELYADVFARCYGMQIVGLRYFNVFGPRQQPAGPYAAVIPRWVEALMTGRPCIVNGDGATSRDFCFVANAVQANVRAALVALNEASSVYNVACGQRITLLELHSQLVTLVREAGYDVQTEPEFAPFREGDIRHSLADIAAIRRDIGYAPTHTAYDGLPIAVAAQVQGSGHRVPRGRE